MFKEYEESSFLQEKTKATNNKIKSSFFIVLNIRKFKIPELTEEDMPVV